MSDFIHPVTVRYLEVDQQGVVFNMWYLAWLDDAMTAFLDAAGADYEEMLARGYDVQVVHTSLDFRSAVRFRDPVAIAVRPLKLGTTSFRLGFDVCVQDEARVLAEIVYVCISRDGSGKRSLPGGLRAALSS